MALQAANKVVVNTGILYLRMLFTVGLSLYTTRLLLNVLGVQDYGIFNLVAGVIAMLSFLSNAMATSTQRYLSFHQGKKDLSMQRRVFINSLVLHVAIGAMVVLALQVLGLFLFDGFLNIPPERVPAAKTIYHYMSTTVFFTVLAVPFTGSLTAHENMLWVALVNTAETLMRLGIACLLMYVSADRLSVFGMLTAGASVVSFLLYALYCFRTYSECSLRSLHELNRSLMMELAAFAGWNLFGSLCTVGRLQGIAVLLNLFFGAAINAAYGIANQVAAQLSFFSATMLRALNPQIMKSEGAGDRDRMLRLSMMACKFGFFLLAFIAVPCLFEMPTILRLWLKNVPDYTVIFCRLILVGAMLNQQTIGLVAGLQAVGKIKTYQAVVGSCLLLNLPVAYLLLKLQFPPYAVLISYLCIELVACVLRFVTIRKVAGLSTPAYVQRVLAKEILPLVLMVAACGSITHWVEGEYRFIATFAVAFPVFGASILLLGLCKDERELLLSLLRKAREKFTRKKSNNEELHPHNHLEPHA